MPSVARILPILLFSSLWIFGPGGQHANAQVSVEAEAASLDHSQERPHILIILADDLGWKDVSYHGSEIRTPNIDRIAREGLELDRFYVQPICSPTRTAMMTGKSPISMGIELPIAKTETRGLPLEETLLPEHLARLGYQSVMSGKWHLGHYLPDYFPGSRGFESYYGHVTGGIGYWDHNHGGGHDWQRDGLTLREDGYSTHLIANEAIRLVEERDETRPLFLYVAFNSPHLPNEAPIDALDRYASIPNLNRRAHAGMVDELDRAIGQILASFEAEGLLEDTLVLFSSDNGGIVHDSSPPRMISLSEFLVGLFGRPLPIASLEFLATNTLDGGSNNDPLPRGKGSIFEGGARVPAAVWWPGRIEGGKHEGFMTISDVLPTLLEAVGADDAIPNDLNGRSQWAALNGEASGSETPDYVTTAIDGAALYQPPWKLHASDPPRLYDIFADPYEENDLAAVHPERVEQMTAMLEAWPRGTPMAHKLWHTLFDPDSFGGPEDRAPWADVARENAAKNAP